MAGTAAAARAVARHCDGRVVAPGGEAGAVAPLPIAALDLEPAITHALRRAGLKTVGQVAERQRSELVVRLGAATLATLDEALGRAATPITPRRPSPAYWRQQAFAEPLTGEEAIRAALARLGLALCGVLERHGEGARRLEALFFRADGAERRIAIEFGAPTRDAAMIGRLFRERLAALADPLDPGFGFDLIRLCATGTQTLDAGAITFARPGPR